MVDEAAPDDGEVRYVLVPVPREYVLDVMRWVLFRAPDNDVESGARDAVRLTAALQEVEEADREFLLLLARNAVLGAEPARLSELAEDLDSDPGWVTTAAGRLNRNLGRDIIELAHETSVGARGKVGKTTYLSMRVDHARTVRAALDPDNRWKPLAADDDKATAPS